MLKIWIATVRNNTTAHSSAPESQRWCEKHASYNPEHPVRWHTSGQILELRNTVTGFLLAEIKPMKVQEPEELYTGEIVYLNIKYPFEKLEKGMTALFHNEFRVIAHAYKMPDEAHGRINTDARQYNYAQYSYSRVTLADAIRLEDDPIKKAAYQALAGDPQATDLMRDVLKC